MEWDAIKWSNNYRKSSIEKKKELLIDVWENTVKIVQNGRYFADEEILIDSSKVAENTLFFKNKQFPNRAIEDFLSEDDLPEDNVKISIIDGDCLESARFLKNPVILNMASYKNPGGGVINGSAAQEENIFRRTNLFKSLYQFTHYSDVYGIKRNMTFGYPLLNLDGIYSKDITVFRGSEKNGYYLLSSPFKVSMISVSAVKRPMLKDGKMSEADLKMNRQKIKMIFQIAHEQGHREMVLSAFGCGSYGNPPEQIAKIFKDVIENDFAGYFDKIVFAIFDDHNSYREHNPDGNLKPFKKIFLNLRHYQKGYHLV